MRRSLLHEDLSLDGSERLPMRSMVRDKACDMSPEFHAVVSFDQMTNFMDEEIIQERIRQKHDPIIERDRPKGRRAPPSCALRTDRDPRRCDPVMRDDRTDPLLR